MNEYDVLYELSTEKVTENDADTLLSNILSSTDAPNIEKRLKLSTYEWTAYCHGATLKEVSLWRYSGWPLICVSCSQKIDINKFGWCVIQVGSDSKLKHIQCFG